MDKSAQPVWKIRQATPEDVVKIRTMHAQAWRDTYPSEENGVSAEWVRDVTEQWLEPNKMNESIEKLSAVFSDSTQFYRSAWVRDEVIGFIHLLTREDGCKLLAALYVDKDYHGSGVAHELMAQAMDFIGDDDTELEVATYNGRAIRFYEKYGFEIDHDGGLFKGKIPCLIMTRRGEK